MFDLRYMQVEAKESVLAEWEKVQSTAVVMATGVGKTELYMAVATEVPGRALVLAHRDYLLSQPIARLKAHGFDDVAVEKAELRSEMGGMYRRAKVVFASVQTLSKPDRLSQFDPMEFDVLIVDEGHRAVAASYRKVIEHFRGNPRLRVLILTATPKRKDGVALGHVADSVAYTYGPKQAAEEGWLVPLKFYRREVAGLDFSRVALKGADLDAEAVERLMLEEGPLHEVCASLAERDRGATIVFCPGVHVARAYSALMDQRYRPGRSAVLWADSDDRERETVTAKLANGDIDYVFNVDLFTEGYDVPNLERVVWAAPTASLVRYTQGTGRVFRPHGSLRTQLTGTREQSAERRLLIDQSPKPFGHVVTFYPQNCRHQLCDPTDILGGDDLPADVRAAAKRVQEATAAQIGGSNPEEDVETAKAFVELRALLDERRRHLKAQAQVTDVQYDGMGGSGARMRSAGDGSGRAQEAAAVSGVGDWPAGKPASDGQVGYLVRLGVPRDIAASVTSWHASTAIDLIRLGVPGATAIGYGKRQALAVLGSIKEKAAA